MSAGAVQRASHHRHTAHEHEHDFEVEPGLPQALPQGERVLWKGGPDWRVLARECFHIRKLAVYFAALVALRVWSITTNGAPLLQEVAATGAAVALAVIALGLVALIARLSARTTVYTITDRRIVMRVGIVLSVTFNLPFKRIEAADLRPSKDGHGDIALTLDQSTRIAYLHLWPHARPWRVARVQPSLRSIPDAARVAAELAQAWKSSRDVEAVVMRPVRTAARPATQPRLSIVQTARTADHPLDAVEAA